MHLVFNCFTAASDSQCYTCTDRLTVHASLCSNRPAGVSNCVQTGAAMACFWEPSCCCC
jgi:hypothetical protein